MRNDLVLLVFAVIAILVAGAALHGGRWPGQKN